MRYSIKTTNKLAAHIKLPASKSISNRALVLHALAKGTSLPQNLSDCDDTDVMIRALNGLPPCIDIKAAGTAMRFLTALLSVTPGTRLITGTERMRQRPIRLLVDALRSLGADIEYAENEGFPPLRITGKTLQSNPITLAGNVSSQYISALLMIGATLPNGLKLELTGDIISSPYINLTLKLMHDFGAEAAWSSPNTIEVKAGGYQDTPYYIESDWSAASYWYQMMALCPDTGSSIELQGLFANSYQGDSRGAKIFEKLGVFTTYNGNNVTLTKTNCRTERLDEDMVDIPDLAQTFVVTCCMLGIPFRFTGLQSLKIKETDRIEALKVELAKLGFLIKDEQDSILSWDGERCTPETHPVIATYEDHRMAMAFAPISLVQGEITIAHPEVVSKSYPSYWEHLRQAGFSIIENESAC